MDRRRQTRRNSQGALRDLLLISLAALVLFWLGDLTRAFEHVQGWIAHRFPGREDEVILGFALLALALGLFAALRWREARLEVAERWRAEGTLTRHDAILQAVSFAAERLMKTPSWKDELPEVLARIGMAADAGRAYVFENELGDEGSLLMSQRAEWAAPGVTPYVDDPDNQRFPYRGTGFESWEDTLSSGGVIHGNAREFPDAIRADLESEQVTSVAVVPIFVGEKWWGYVGFDEWRGDRTWPQAEIEALKTAADTLGVAIGRERAERALREAETRYRTLVEQIPAVTYIHGPRSGMGLRYISPQLEAMLGYTPEEWGADPDLFWRLLHPDDLERVRAEDRRTDETGEPFRVEYRMTGKDGRLVWTRDEAVLVRDENGRPHYWQGVRFDITAQKQVEEQLRDAESRYRSLVETIPAVTYVDLVDELSTTIYVSPQIQTMLGYSVERWREDRALWTRNLHPVDRDHVTDASIRHNETGEPFDQEYRIRAADGRWVWIRDQAAIVRGQDGQPLFSQGVMFDITGRRQSEEQLRETEAKYRALVEHIPAVLYVHPADERSPSLYVSPQLEQVMGASQERYLSDPNYWLELIHPDDRDRVIEAYRRSLERREGWAVEYQVIRPDGRAIWVRDDSAFLGTDEEGAGLVQGVMTDITDRKLAEEALRESERRERDAAERLRALDEMKNTFLTAVSHELRSPLTSILGLAVTLEHQDLPDPDRRDLLERLALNARKLDRLLKDLLDIDRLSRGIVTPRYRPTDVGALVRRTVDNLDVPPDRSIRVEAEPVVVPTDPPKVERIVENLVANAVRHTGPDATIWVRVRAEDGGALLAVEDDGPGVPRHLRQAIFEPFRQGPTASPHSPGTGIGLSLVAMFAELHGGRAWVEERDGGGASFRVFLPAVAPQTLDSAAAEEREAQHLDSATAG